MGYNSLYNRMIKPIIGFILAIVILTIIWPIYLIISILILVDSGWPIFYTPLRGGYKNYPFRIFKFRTMVKNADKIGGSTTALNDKRITHIGRFLRKTKLDEIPQLFNILSFKMSFIGPRPELLKYVDNYNEEEKIILEVRPGITDFSSLEFINLDELVGTMNADEIYEKHILKKKNKLRMDYSNKVSFMVDVNLFFKTILGVVKKCWNYLLSI